MRSSVISLGLAVIIGVVIGLLLQSPPTPPVSTTSADDSSRGSIALQPTTGQDNALDTIRQQLRQEITARKKLQDSVNTLNKKLAQLETQNQPTASTSEDPSPHNTPAGGEENRAWFNEQALIDAGVDPTTAKTLKSRYETQELEKLYVRDKAMREGWFGSRRYRDELEKLDAQLNGLQKELGDESYAAFLYATGQANRVVVQSVLANSSADTAGIRPNDQITRYAGQKIYNWRDLRNATAQGDVNESVTVELIRDGKPIEVYLQRGPLGIRMDSVSIAP
jgi:C-terminal processing protease CtpA/Prc